jgi:hypothetical protein
MNRETAAFIDFRTTGVVLGIKIGPGKASPRALAAIVPVIPPESKGLHK